MIMKQNIFEGFALALVLLLLMSCGEDANYSQSTDAVVTSITTGEASVTAISATTNGNVQNLSGMASSTYQVGTVYGTSTDPTNGGIRQVGSIDDKGNVVAVLTGLTEGVTYYYATFVTLQGKVTRYGEVKSFVATNVAVSTKDATLLTSCTALLHGQASGIDNILSDARVGFKYALSADGVAMGVDVPVAETQGEFSVKADALLPSTTYYYAAYTKVGDGFIYGNVRSFTTADQTMEYVDLGLSVLWAKCNIGSERESESGVLIGFGDQSFYNRSLSNNDYLPWDAVGSDDVLYHLHIDGDAKMKSKLPSAAQIEELIRKTSQEYVYENSVPGVRFTAANGNSIFLPLCGYRNGDAVVRDGHGYYWSGNVNEVNENYGKTLHLNGNGVSIGTSIRAYGLSIRSVRENEPPEKGITVRNYNAVQGDIENKGNYRFDIFNAWDGSNTGSDNTSVLIPSEVNFKKSISVTFTIKGIGNAECKVYMTFADGTWATSNWGFNDNGEGSCMVKGDGTYIMTLHGAGAGLGVFSIDFIGLSAAVGEKNIYVKLNTCVMDE